MMMVLAFTGGAFCLASYAVNIGMLKEAIGGRMPIWQRGLYTLGFIASPIVVPIGIMLLLLVY